MERLAQWLKKIYPRVVDELDDYSLSNAMASCQNFNSDSKPAVKMLQKINISENTQEQKKEVLIFIFFKDFILGCYNINSKNLFYLSLMSHNCNIYSGWMYNSDINLFFKGLHISSISWNSTGNTIAVSCSFKHEIWCYHQGEVRLYTFVR